jgi:hypothetical protein
LFRLRTAGWGISPPDLRSLLPNLPASSCSTARCTCAGLSASRGRSTPDFYQPSNLSDDELREHRQKITQDRPGLPTQAGKAFRQLSFIYLTARDYAHGDELAFHRTINKLAMPGAISRHTERSVNGKSRTISVAAVLRPEPDYKKLARALTVIVQQRIEEGLDPVTGKPKDRAA